MPTTVWINGEFLDPAQARVSAFDAGFQHAVGLFETIHARNGRPAFLWRHLARLQNSARELGLSSDLRINPSPKRSPAPSNADSPRRVRVTITWRHLLAAALARRRRPAAGNRPRRRTARHRLPRRHVRARRLVNRRAALNPSTPPSATKHQLLDAPPRTPDRTPRGGAEALFFTLSNHLPAARRQPLPRQRQHTPHPIARGEEPTDAERALARPPPRYHLQRDLRFAKAAGLDTNIRMLTINDLLDADEAFLTNSSWGVLPVVQVEAKPIADAKPGPVTRDLRARWLDALERADEA